MRFVVELMEKSCPWWAARVQLSQIYPVPDVMHPIGACYSGLLRPGLEVSRVFFQL